MFSFLEFFNYAYVLVLANYFKVTGYLRKSQNSKFKVVKKQNIQVVKVALVKVCVSIKCFTEVNLLSTREYIRIFL